MKVGSANCLATVWLFIRGTKHLVCPMLFASYEVGGGFDVLPLSTGIMQRHVRTNFFKGLSDRLLEVTSRKC